MCDPVACQGGKGGVGEREKERSTFFDGGKDDGSYLIFKMNRKCHHFHFLITFRVGASTFSTFSWPLSGLLGDLRMTRGVIYV